MKPRRDWLRPKCCRCGVACDPGPEFVPGYFYPLCASCFQLMQPRCEKCRFPEPHHWMGCVLNPDVGERKRYLAEKWPELRLTDEERSAFLGDGSK